MTSPNRTPQARALRWPRRIGARLAKALAPALLATVATAALAGGPTDRLTLLVPDGADMNSWQVKVWVDSAADEGIRLDVITDSQLLAMGNTAAGRIAGLVVPDSAHIRASDAMVAVIKQYAYLGGKLMLVYDAGVQTDGGFFPLSGNSRFADMVGVDYVFWNNGAGAATMVGFGPVVGTQARLESLSIPPGKYMPYTPPATLATTTAATTAFVPTSQADPSGMARMADTVTKRHKGIEDGSQSVRDKRAYSIRNLLGLSVEGNAALRYGVRNLLASKARDQHVGDVITRYGDEVAAVLSADTNSAIEVAVKDGSAAPATLNTISGYGYGPIGYYHYVTTGTFPGTVYLSSPEHGLVAGNRAYGSGQVLFVNLPLGYFKAIGTDSAPMQGFLNLFAREQVGIATMSVQPRGKGGLIYNWHVDDGDDLNSNVKDLLAKTNFFYRGPFSIHFTAGPDVINFGDGNGMDLPNNPSSQALVKKLGNIGQPWWNIPLANHALGSHGGWIHDYWGLNASETNAPDLTWLLQKNFDAIEKVTGRKIREYSSPVGNTPTWAVKWLEARGVNAMYLVGDLGAGAVRSWRNGARLTNKLWTFPVSPLGKYATFEEFDAFGISDAVSGQWLLDLQSFAVNKRTNRMFYNHPPGALGHVKPLNALLNRGEKLQDANRFAWYTMSDLADFQQRRVETTWTTSSVAGKPVMTFEARHATTLANTTWLLPKSHYYTPWINYVYGGWATVSQDSKNWIVTVEAGSYANFAAGTH